MTTRNNTLSDFHMLMNNVSEKKNHLKTSASYVANRASQAVGAADFMLSTVGQSFLPAPIPVMKFAAKAILVDLAKPASTEYMKQLRKSLKEADKKAANAISRPAPRDWFTGRTQVEDVLHQKFVANASNMATFKQQSMALQDMRIVEKAVADLNHVESVEVLQNKDQAISEFVNKQEQLASDYYNKITESATNNVHIEMGIKEGEKVDAKSMVGEFKAEHNLQPAMDYVKAMDESAKEYAAQMNQAAKAEFERQQSMRSNPFFIDPKAQLRMPNPKFFN